MPPLALVVDDSMLIRHAVCRYLEERGFDVESATNGTEALEMLKRMQPSVIITDLQMPKMTGHQLIDAVKGNARTAQIPIVILAGRQSSQEEHSESRANYVIYKDIDIAAQLPRALDAAMQPSTSG